MVIHTSKNTPLHAACINGNIDMVNILLKCNSSVDLCDTDGYTPLHVACINGNIDIVNILLKCNSSVNLCGFTLLLHFSKMLTISILPLSQATCKGVNPLVPHRFTLLLHFSKMLTISIWQNRCS
jgi:ankyrin repeat protein